MEAPVPDAIGDFSRCRWPGCDCYAPQGLQKCSVARFIGRLARARVVPFPTTRVVTESTPASTNFTAKEPADV